MAAARNLAVRDKHQSSFGWPSRWSMPCHKAAGEKAPIAASMESGGFTRVAAIKRRWMSEKAATVPPEETIFHLQ